ncbi:MAG: peptide MFS transporter [Cytophagales bacterium]|nr:peptide MFS transporter [Cytophagales bacterium]
MEKRSSSQSHPAALYLLFTSEMWDSDLATTACALVLYLTKALAFNKEIASHIYGGYVGLVYLTPLIGGFIADRYWGNRRSILVGGILMALGQFSLFTSALFRQVEHLSLPFLFLGLGLMILGNGFFKPNISSMVGSLYAPDDSRRDSAYTIFYLGINIGAFLGNLVTSLVGDTGNPDDFKWAFLAVGIAMTLGTVIFYWGRNKLLVSWENKPVGITPTGLALGDVKKIYYWLPILLVISLAIMYVDAFVYNIVFPILVVSGIVIVVIVFMDKSLTPEDRQKVATIFVISFFVIFFWATFEQAPASLTFFADEQTDRQLFGWTVPPSLFQNLNALFIIIFSLPMAAFWGMLNRYKIEPSSPIKMSWGLILVALGYVVILFAVKDLQPNVKVSMFYLVGLYFLHTIGELCLSPIGLSLVNKLSPPKFISLMMAVWFLAPAIANKAAGMISAFYPQPGKSTFFLGFPITNLYEFFLINVFLSGVAGLLLLLIAQKIAFVTEKQK